MKIGILTYHRATNYGAVLQSYGLINKLKEDFPQHSFEIIDYSTINALIDHKKEEILAFRNGGFKLFKDIKSKNKMFKKFSDALPLSKFKIVSNNIGKLFKKMNINYDIVIVGSDAVFSWNGKKFPTAYYLDESSKYIKMSYAASAHRLYYRETEYDKIEYCKNTLRSYNYIGVRDEETKRLINYIDSSLMTFHNCDPSFLIEQKKIYSLGEKGISVIKRKFCLQEERKIVFLMTGNKKIGEQVRKFFPSCFIVSLFVYNDFSDIYLSTLEPFEWAAIFKEGIITISEYFHATIFSLKCGTPALAIDMLSYASTYEGKIHDLLVNRMNLPILYVNIDTINEKGYNVIFNKLNDIVNDNTLNKNIEYAIDKEKEYYYDFYNYLKKELKKDE